MGSDPVARTIAGVGGVGGSLGFSIADIVVANDG